MICNKKTLYQLLEQNALVMTPNNRLSATLIKDYFLSRERQTLEKPRCLPYGTALRQAYQNYLNKTPQSQHPVVVSIHACRLLFKRQLEAEPALIANDGLLSAVLQTWQHAELWQLEREDDRFQQTEQMQLFQKWRNQLLNTLESRGLIHEHQLVEYLCNSNEILFSSPVIWACFDEFTPQQQALQKHLEAQGIQQLYYDLPNQKNQSISCLHGRDKKDEVLQLTIWLKKKLSEGKERIGVVVPDLQSASEALSRHFRNHFDEASYTISLGKPLNQYALVTHALNWLQWSMREVTPHQMALLLQSPYVAGARDEFFPRAQLLQDSRLMQQQHVSIKRWAHELYNKAPKLAKALTQLKAYPATASVHEWIDAFMNRLNTMGFPGDYGFHSEQYQVFQRLLAVFDELKTTHLVADRLSQSEALNALAHQIQQTTFQIQKPDTPIQISGLLEASGCEFDCLWIMGLTDQTLPQKSKLSPFIPHHLQKELNMPHCSADRELLFATKSLHRLYAGSKECVVSYPRLDGDQPNLPSPLINGLGEYQPLPTEDVRDNRDALEFYEETYLIPQAVNETLSGGSYALANQAKCPFKAFAEHRLKAHSTPKPSEGIDPKERGKVIHRAMELLWTSLQSQEQLLSLEPSALKHLIDGSINQALSEMSAAHPKFTQTVEIRRLKKLIHACLDWERQRPPFKIAALEQSFSINLAGVDFKVRVDRMDFVDKNTWVIDYKSSLPSTKPWYEERPKEPQLLLYALLNENINTLIHLQLKTGNVHISGISEETIELPGIAGIKKNDSWTSCITRWQHQLLQLAEEYQKGICAPKPSLSSTCQFCEHQALCRLNFSL